MTLPSTDVPSGTTTVTVFDTNAYRNLTYGLSLPDAKAKLAQLRVREEHAGVLALASPTVIWELSSHLADAADPAYNHCLTALAALGEHARSTLASAPGIRLARDSDWLVCDVLFSRAPSDPAIHVEDLGALATYIRDNAPPITDAAVLSNVQVFSNTMAARETAWLADIQKLLDYVEQTAKSKDDRRAVREALNSNGFEELWAILAVAHYADLSGVSLDRNGLENRALFFQAHFGAPFQLILTLLKNLIGSPNLNLLSAKKKRGNFMWDAGIAYLIPTGAGASANPIEIVSGDQALIAAAVETGCSNTVITLDQYCKRFGI